MLLHALVEWMGESPASQCSAQAWSEGMAQAHLEGEALAGSFLSLESSERWRAFHFVVNPHPCGVSKVWSGRQL